MSLQVSTRGRAMPAAALTMSAWADLSASGSSHESCAAADPINQRSMLLAMARIAATASLVATWICVI